MNWKFAFFIILIAFIVTNCSKQRYIGLEKSRVMQPSEIKTFHPDLNITVGWVPYQDQRLIQTSKNEWRIAANEDGSGAGSVPVIIISYPDSKDSILLDMNIENELLGKLVKHSAMTQETISRPFNSYFEKAKCSKCHPPHIEAKF